MSVAPAYKALADPTRRRILRLLQDDDLAAGEIASHFDIAWPSVSRHLTILSQAGLIRGQRHGQSIVYSISTSVLADIVAELADLAGIGRTPVQRHLGSLKEVVQ